MNKSIDINEILNYAKKQIKYYENRAKQQIELGKIKSIQGKHTELFNEANEQLARAHSYRDIINFIQRNKELKA